MNNIKSLYITDLDGTLLDRDAQLSKETVSILKPLIKKGLPLVCCTARSFIKTIPITDMLGCSFPIVCYSGGMIYDPMRQRIMRSQSITKEQVYSILELTKQTSLSPFIYTMADDMSEHVYYNTINSSGVEQYLKERSKRDDYRFIYDPSHEKWQFENCYYVSFMGSKDLFTRFLPLISSHCDITVNFYESYYYKGTWWLEIMNKEQSKGNALLYLKDLYQAESTIAFGDTNGDLSMIQVSDIGIAVENASEELKKAADIIIESNVEHSVARYIAKHFSQFL